MEKSGLLDAIVLIENLDSDEKILTWAQQHLINQANMAELLALHSDEFWEVNNDQ